MAQYFTQPVEYADGKITGDAPVQYCYGIAEKLVPFRLLDLAVAQENNAARFVRQSFKMPHPVKVHPRFPVHKPAADIAHTANFLGCPKYCQYQKQVYDNG